MIPEGWQQLQIKDFIRSIDSGYSAVGENRTAREGEAAVLTLAALSDGRFRPDRHKTVSESEAENLRVTPKAGRILISRSNTLELVGAAVYVHKDYPRYFLPDLIWQLEPADEKSISMAWFCYFLQSNYGRTEIKKIAAGSNASMVKIGKAAFSNLTILVPPLAEQRKIAAILGTWDEAIAAVERLIKALQERKRGLMQRLLTGQVRFAGFEGEWNETEIQELGMVASGGTPDTTNSEYWDGDILWVTPSEITKLPTKYIDRTERTITNSGLKGSSAYLLPPRSIIVCTRATVGDVAINLVPISTNQGFKNIILKDKFHAEFVYHAIVNSKHKLMRLSSGSTFLELSKTAFEKIGIVIPEYEEQVLIAQVLDKADKQIESLREYTIKLQAQKKALMQRLLTGQVRVSEAIGDTSQGAS